MRVFGRRISSRRPHRPSVLRSTRRHCPRNRAPCSPVDRHQTDILEPHLILPLARKIRFGYVHCTYASLTPASSFTFLVTRYSVIKRFGFLICDLFSLRPKNARTKIQRNAKRAPRQAREQLRTLFLWHNHPFHPSASLTSIDTQPRSTREKQFDHGAVSTFVLRRPSRAGRLRQIR